ncbi:MAG: VOC family protein, partial [Gemmatimonadaceae bacterium]
NHANLPVVDVASLRDFFVQQFDFTVLSMRGENAFAVLRGPDGFILNIMRDRNDVGYPENFHVGFFLDSPDDVRAKHAQMQVAKLAPGPIEELSRGGWKSLTFYCRAPNNILVEVGAGLR